MRVRRGPVAQLVEQGTFNPKVAGSIPARPITRKRCKRRPTEGIAPLKSETSRARGQLTGQRARNASSPQRGRDSQMSFDFEWHPLDVIRKTTFLRSPRSHPGARRPAQSSETRRLHSDRFHLTFTFTPTGGKTM